MLGSKVCQDSTPETREGNFMRRKRFQRGSVKPRKRNGKNYWYAQWREDGKPKSKELGLCSKITRIEAEGLLADILKPINTAAQPGPPEHTFQSFVEEIYLPIAHRRWKKSTGMTEVNRLQVHLVAPLGRKPIKEVTREEMQSLLDMKARTLSQSCVDHLRFRLRSVFELALSEGVVDRNPARTLFTPRNCKSGQTRNVLTAEQARKMTETLDLREKIIVRLATWEGMRPGEILALQFGDIEEDSLWVKRRLYRGNIDSPKTRRSYRQVALTEATVKLLGLWMEATGTGRPEAWLFPSENRENPVSRDNIWRRSIYPRLKTIGLGWASFQVMRRTFATLSRQAGVDAHTRSAQMGNTVDVNENEYAVSVFNDRLAAVRKLETAVQ